MAKYRRDKIIDSMFLDIATPEERVKVNQLYETNKGSAIVYQVKRIRAHWKVMLGKESAETLKRYNPNARTFILNEGGFSRPVAY